jgi:hypothetical protein
VAKLSTADVLPSEVESVRNLYRQAAQLRDLADAALQALVDRARDEDGMSPGDPREDAYFRAYADLVGSF